MADPLNFRLRITPEATSGPTLTGLALNDTDNAVWAVFQSETVDPITHVFMRHASTTGTSPTYRASIQGVSATGMPDGTIKGGGSPASRAFSPTALSWGAATGQWLALDNAWTPTRGEEFAIYVTYDSGTVGAGNTSNITYVTNMPPSGKPYGGVFQTSYTKLDGFPSLAYRTASGVFGLPIQAVSQQAYQSGSAANEYGVRFVVPTVFGNTYKITGVRLLCTLPANSTYSITLYDGGGASDTTVLQSMVNADGDFTQSGNRQQTLLFTDSPLATLTCGNIYRIAIRAGGAVNTTLNYIDVSEVNDWSAWPLGADCYWTHRGGGNWTDVTTRRPFGEMLISDLTPPSGGSSSTGILLGGLGMTGIGAF
jgi:hypothetical protein